MLRITLKTSLMMSYLIPIMNKDFTSFKCWKKKTCNRPKTRRVSSVDGISGDANIANRFAGHFSNSGVDLVCQVLPMLRLTLTKQDNISF